MKLLLAGPVTLGGLPGEGQERLALALGLDQLFDPADAERADQLVFQVGHANEEAARGQAGPARPSRQEHVKGSIAPGLLADLVVLSEDPTAVSPERIAGLAVLATLVGGQVRYDAGAVDGLS